jgi:hypothetical protein
MKLDVVISWLEQEFGDDSAVRVEIIPAKADAVTGERVPRPIRDVSVDDSDKEVHLLVNASPWDEAEPIKPPMTVSTLLSRLRELDDRESYSVVSGDWQKIDEDYVFRIDWPLEGIATNEDETVVAFVERVMGTDGG